MIFALTGAKGSGKDTIALYLVEKYGFVKLSFAKALKDIVAVIFSWDREKLEGVTDEDRLWREEVDKWWEIELGILGFTPRYALENIGTDVFRNHFHTDIWILSLKKAILDATKTRQNVVITDCRFLNEEIFVNQFKGSTILRVSRGDDETPTGHISNQQYLQIKYNHMLTNNGTIEDLQNKIDELLYEDNSKYGI